METPTNKHHLRPPRNPTPRLSERKKKLFETHKLVEGEEDDDSDSDVLCGIQPLKTTQNDQNGAGTPKSRNNVQKLLRGDRHGKAISFFREPDTDESSEPDVLIMKTVRRSPRLRQQSSSSSSPENNKENRRSVHITAAEEQLPQLFTASMYINSVSEGNSNMSGPHKKKTIDCNTPRCSRLIPNVVIDETSSDEDIPRVPIVRTSRNKRSHTPSGSVESEECASPQRKMYKMDIAIPTKAFYSKSNTPSRFNASHSNRSTTKNSTKPASRKISPRHHRVAKSSSKIHQNKGVSHSIRKSVTSTFDRVNVDELLSHMNSEKLRKLIATKREERKQIEKVHDIFRNAKDPIKMAQPLSALNDANDNNNNTNSSEVQLPDAQSQQFDLGFSDIEQSDESDRENERTIPDQNEEVIPLIRHEPTISPNVSPEEQPCAKQRKFFKSGRRSSTHMEVKITDTIRASVCNGKISLVQQKHRKVPRLKVKSKVSSEFSAEQATVEAILRNLDDTAFGDIIETEANLPEIDEPEIPPSDYIQADIVNNATFENFRSRLPYNTNDPRVIEQQNLLLDFLIINNICTEKNFDIFIANPEDPANKEAAAGIVDHIVLVVNEQEMEFRRRLPYNTSDPATIEQQEYFLNLLVKNNMLSEENFDIFIANFEHRKNEALAILEAINVTTEAAISEVAETESMQIDSVHDLEEIEEIVELMRPSSPSTTASLEPTVITATEESVPIEFDSNRKSLEPANENECRSTTSTDQAKSPQKLFPIFTQQLVPLVPPNSTRKKHSDRVWKGGEGVNQYQIDAGQKQFGHTQCKQCGLVYTAHEPEEEKLHREYHQTTSVLRFGGWIDEDIVAVYPEWACNGRIIRLNDHSYMRRIDRLDLVLSLAGKELGSPDYTLPDTFVAYLAVRRNRIVGVCVVEPIVKARRYMFVDGIDYCSEEEYDVKCGISRIWVCPLNRRIRIASKLIKAVQMNTIPGEDIAIEQIAFSSPTDDGKLFAQKLSQTEHILVYQ